MSIKVRVIWSSESEQDLGVDVHEINGLTWEEYVIRELGYDLDVDNIMEEMSKKYTREIFGEQLDQDPEFDPFWGMTDDQFTEFNEEVKKKCKETKEYKELLDTVVTSEFDYYPKTLKQLIEDGEFMEISEEGMSKTTLIEE